MGTCTCVQTGIFYPAPLLWYFSSVELVRCCLTTVFYLDQVSGEQVRLPSRNAVVQDLPSLPQAELHDVMLDWCCMIGRQDPGEQDSLLGAIGCEAPWWGKQHQWFGGTYGKYWKSTCGLGMCVCESLSYIFSEKFTLWHCIRTLLHMTSSSTPHLFIQYSNTIDCIQHVRYRLFFLLPRV